MTYPDPNQWTVSGNQDSKSIVANNLLQLRSQLPVHAQKFLKKKVPRSSLWFVSNVSLWEAGDIWRKVFFIMSTITSVCYLQAPLGWVVKELGHLLTTYIRNCVCGWDTCNFFKFWKVQMAISPLLIDRFAWNKCLYLLFRTFCRAATDFWTFKSRT